MWQFWIIASGIFFVAEIFTAGFLVFWLGVAALIAMISSFITSNIIIQTAIFVIFSVILLMVILPISFSDIVYVYIIEFTYSPTV